MPDGAQHVAFAYSADGKDRFTTVWPNLNLIDGTKDFSGNWSWNDVSTNDGTYKGLTVKKRTGQWGGIYKTFTVPKDGTYTFSAYVKGSGTGTKFVRVVMINGVEKYNLDKTLDSPFDWMRDSITFSAKDIKAGDQISVSYNISSLGTNLALWTAGHKWEEGSTATPWMPSFSEVTASDYPSYIGTYTDNNPNEQSTDPEKYTWKKIE